MGKLKKIDEIPRRVWRITANAPHGEVVDPGLKPESPTSPPASVELVEANWVWSSWDLLTGLDVVETAPGELFQEFFDSESGAARERAPAAAELGKDQWMLAFAIELAELDRHLDPKEVIRLAKMLWLKKRRFAPEDVARDAYSAGWMLR